VAIEPRSGEPLPLVIDPDWIALGDVPVEDFYGT
jgi:hypothetical protein